MPKFQFSLFALTALLLVSVSTASFAQTTGGGEGINGQYGDGPASLPDPEPSDITPGSATAAAAITSSTSIVTSLQAATRYCTPLGPKEYVIDCLAERLGTLSNQLEGQDGFEEVQAILDSTAKDLNQIARQNRSATLAPATFATQGQTPVQTTRRLIPVDEARMEDAVSQALAVIAETETLLLRSADDSTDRSIQFQQIAAAVGSNKVLLRSL
ncbi:MAG: hypothetical protein COC12_01170 [Rhodobacteraceae bacterium]|nr:MAG: hypothetical protein COC12_01170 [Paracoccaceae bacterium]